MKVGEGYHPERALRPHDQLAQVGSRRAGGMGREVELSGRGRAAQAEDELVDAPIARGRLPGRARGDVAADRGVLVALREVAEREALRVELGLGRRAAQAGLERRRERAPVDPGHPVEAAQVERDDGGELAAQRLHAADHARPPAERDDRDLRLRAGGEDRDHLLVVRRVDDGVRRVLAVTCALPHEVGIALARRVDDAGLEVVADVLGADDRGRAGRARRRAAPGRSRAPGRGARADGPPAPGRPRHAGTPRRGRAGRAGWSGSPQPHHLISPCIAPARPGPRPAAAGVPRLTRNGAKRAQPRSRWRSTIVTSVPSPSPRRPGPAAPPSPPRP